MPAIAYLLTTIGDAQAALMSAQSAAESGLGLQAASLVLEACTHLHRGVGISLIVDMHVHALEEDLKEIIEPDNDDDP